MTNEEDSSSTDLSDKSDGCDRSKHIEGLNDDDTLSSAQTLISKAIRQEHSGICSDGIVTSETLEGHDQDGSPTGTFIAIISQQSLLVANLSSFVDSTLSITAYTSCGLLGQKDVIDLLLVAFSDVNFLDYTFSRRLIALNDVVSRWIGANKDVKEDYGKDIEHRLQSKN